MVLLLAVAGRFLTAQQRNRLPDDQNSVKVVRAIDGDTLLLEDGSRIRLLGVNTPETKHPERPAEPFGPEAHDFSERMTACRHVRLEYDRERRDQYRRILAYVYLPDGRMLNRLLIEEGFSPAILTFPIRSDRSREFAAAERHAQQHRRGIWSAQSP